jgi:hypothetical protein
LKSVGDYDTIFVKGEVVKVHSNVNKILDPLFDGRDRLFGVVRPFSGD